MSSFLRLQDTKNALWNYDTGRYFEEYNPGVWLKSSLSWTSMHVTWYSEFT